MIFSPGSMVKKSVTWADKFEVKMYHPNSTNRRDVVHAPLRRQNAISHKKAQKIINAMMRTNEKLKKQNAKLRRKNAIDRANTYRVLNSMQRENAVLKRENARLQRKNA
jgi:hypothetical protein